MTIIATTTATITMNNSDNLFLGRKESFAKPLVRRVETHDELVITTNNSKQLQPTTTTRTTTTSNNDDHKNNKQ